MNSLLRRPVRTALIAAWVIAAQIILNLDETITRE